MRSWGFAYATACRVMYGTYVYRAEKKRIVNLDAASVKLCALGFGVFKEFSPEALAEYLYVNRSALSFFRGCLL